MCLVRVVVAEIGNGHAKFHEFPAAGGCWRAFGVVGKSCCEAYGKKKEGEEVLE